jgi:hypothetical protein
VEALLQDREGLRGRGKKIVGQRGYAEEKRGGRGGKMCETAMWELGKRIS